MCVCVCVVHFSPTAGINTCRSNDMTRTACTWIETRSNARTPRYVKCRCLFRDADRSTVSVAPGSGDGNPLAVHHSCARHSTRRSTRTFTLKASPSLSCGCFFQFSNLSVQNSRIDSRLYSKTSGCDHMTCVCKVGQVRNTQRSSESETNTASHFLPWHQVMASLFSERMVLSVSRFLLPEPTARFVLRAPISLHFTLALEDMRRCRNTAVGQCVCPGNVESYLNILCDLRCLRSDIS